MSTQKRKFELFARLQALGFTYEEAVSLRRIEMTLQRWGELECGTDAGCVERDETTGKPMYRPAGYNAGGNRGWVESRAYPIADREAGALKRLARIVADRNERYNTGEHRLPNQEVTAYHQGDCRGCNLYLLTREQLTDKQTGTALPVDQYYTRGLAVCA